MVITFTCILAFMLAVIRPLQKNPFFLIYFGLVVGAAYYAETHGMKMTPFAYKTFLAFLVVHLVMINLVTVIAYGTDKRAAIRGKWRVPEIQLHTLELLGGSPGAFVGQKIFRHKTKKKSYRTVFWLVLIFQAGLIVYILKFLHLI